MEVLYGAAALNVMDMAISRMHITFGGNLATLYATGKRRDVAISRVRCLMH